MPDHPFGRRYTQHLNRDYVYPKQRHYHKCSLKRFNPFLDHEDERNRQKGWLT